jgi:phosphatidylglycerophosphatase A
MKLKLTPGSLPPGLSFWHPVSLLATWGGSGLIPFASGTWGSLAAIPVAWLVYRGGGTAALVMAALVIALVGIWASDQIVRLGQVRDPGLIVVDEVAGMFLTLVFAPASIVGWAAGFVLFRAADIFKPFPAGWCDRNLHGGLGVMLDDLVAGLYAGLAVWLLARLGALDHVATLVEL